MVLKLWPLDRDRVSYLCTMYRPWDSWRAHLADSRQRRTRIKQMVEQEQQDQLEQGPEIQIVSRRIEAFRVYLRDLRSLSEPNMRKLRCVPEDEWFPRGREECDPRFWTILQENFYASYVR
jgi:hypothetical protein